ncbi:MAG: hypothetical protein Q7R58_00435 [bacterium]|nr:hypothetical protein [bacterium]
MSRRNKIDTLMSLDGRTQDQVLLSGLRNMSDPFTIVSCYRYSVEKTLKGLDERMCLIIMQDQDDVTRWANVMRACRGMMRVITMNLAFWGKPEWNWEEVAEAMGFLHAITEGARVTLEMNGSEPADTTAP